jgi:hypothetical protein
MLAACLAVLVTGCGGADPDTDPQPREQPRREPVVELAPAKDKGDAHSVTPSRCDPGLPSCRSTSGRVVYVERVDPDGDGDAHFVIADPRSITLPGLTAIDVSRGLRPEPLPGPGDLISAAGPVQTGSYGQSQIHALELHVAAE